MSVEATAAAINGRFSKAVLEGGHRYADPEASPLGQLDSVAGRWGARIGGLINERLVVPFKNWLFLDTYNGQGNIDAKVAAMRPEAVVEEYATLGYRVDRVVLESDEALQQRALGLVAAMIDADPNRTVIETQRTRVYLKRDGQPPYRLCERVKSGENKGALINPTCASLDAALSLDKSQEVGSGGVLVNVVPQEFAAQQDTTRDILRIAGYSGIPLMSVYFDVRNDSPLATVSYTANFRS
jgi:hypothetical protein